MAALSAQLVGIDPGNTAYDGDLQRRGRPYHQQPPSALPRALPRRIAKIPSSALGSTTRRPQYLFIANERRPQLSYEVVELRASYATKAVPVKPHTTKNLTTASQIPARLGAQASRVPEPRKPPPPPSPFSSPRKRVIRMGPPKLGTSKMTAQIDRKKEQDRADAEAADEMKTSASSTAPYRRPGTATFAAPSTTKHTSATTKSAAPSLVGNLKALPRTSPSLRSTESTTSAEYDKKPALNAVESVKTGSVTEMPLASAAKSVVKIVPKPKQVSKQNSKQKAGVSTKDAAKPDTAPKKTLVAEGLLSEAIEPDKVEQHIDVMAAQARQLQSQGSRLINGANLALENQLERHADWGEKIARRQLRAKEEQEIEAMKQRIEEERIRAEDRRLERAMQRKTYYSWRDLTSKTFNAVARDTERALENVATYHRDRLSKLKRLGKLSAFPTETSALSSVDSLLTTAEKNRFSRLRDLGNSPTCYTLPSALTLVQETYVLWNDSLEKHRDLQEEYAEAGHESRRFARLGRYHRGRLDEAETFAIEAERPFTVFWEGWGSLGRQLLSNPLESETISRKLRRACHEALVWEDDITTPDGFIQRMVVHRVMAGSLIDQELFRALYPIRKFLSDERRKVVLVKTMKDYVKRVKRNGASRHPPIGLIVNKIERLSSMWFDMRAAIDEVERAVEKVVIDKARCGQIDIESLEPWLNGIAQQMLDRDAERLEKVFAYSYREQKRLDEAWRKRKEERRRIKGTSPQQSTSTTLQSRHYLRRDRAELRISFNLENSATVSAKDQPSDRKASSSKMKKADKMSTQGHSSAQPSAIGQGKSGWAKRRRAARLAQKAVGTAAAHESSNVDNAATAPVREQPSVRTTSSSKQKEADSMPIEGQPSAQRRRIRKNPGKHARRRRKAALLAQESTLPSNKSETSALAEKRDGTPPVEQIEGAPDITLGSRNRKTWGYPANTEGKESVNDRQGLAAVEQSEGAPRGKVGSSKLSRNARPRDTAEADAASPAVRSESNVPLTGLNLSPSKRLQRHVEVPSDVDGSSEVGTQLLRQDALSDPGCEKHRKICRLRSSADESHRQCCRDRFIGSQVELDVAGISKAGWLDVWASKVALGALGFTSSSASPSSRHGSDRDSAPSGYDGFDAPGSSGTTGPSRPSASSSSSSDSLSSAGPSEEASDADSSSEGHISLSYRLPEQTLAAAMVALQNGEIVFWSHEMYRGPNEEKVLVHYCRRVEDSERVAKLFLKDQVLGFDIEWKPHFRTGHVIKDNVSLIQLASQSRIALFHIALHKGKTREELLAPTLRDVIESPNITKAGVSIKADCTRLRKFLGIQAQSIFELSHLYKVVKYSTFEKRLVDKRLVSLAQQVEEHLQLPLDKGPVRESDWTKALTYQQRTYAASDSYAAVILFDVMERKRKALRPTPPRPAHAELNLPILLLGEGAAGSAEAPGMVNVDYEETPLLTPDDHRSIVNSTLGKHSRAELAEPQPADGLVRPSDHPGRIRSDRELSGEATDVGSVAEAMAELSMSTAHDREPATPHANLTTPLSIANSWVSEYLSKRGPLPGGPRPSASAANLRAYDLWHNQQLDVHSTAAFLRDPPLQSSTAAMYILDALALEGLPYQEERAYTLFPFVSGKMLQTRYKRIRGKVGG